MQKGSVHLLFILIIVLLVAGGVYYYQKIKTNNLPSPQSLTNSKPITDSYLNEQLGIKFQLERGFNAQQDTEAEFNNRGNGNFRKNFTGYVGYEPGQFVGAVVVLDKEQNFDSSPFTIWVFNNDKNLTTNQWFQNYWYYPFLWGVFDYSSKGHVAPDQEATISGQLAKYKIVQYQPGQPKLMYIAKDRKMYLFRIIGQTGDKILSSFKFLQ